MKTRRELEVENETLRYIVADLHWMARRYCDGRMTYSTRTFNDHTRALLAMGVPLNPTGDRTIWAKDGMGRAFDGLSDEEAAMGDPMRTYWYSVLTEGYEEMG
jgi:hypothetical protein